MGMDRKIRNYRKVNNRTHRFGPDPSGDLIKGSRRTLHAALSKNHTTMQIHKTYEKQKL